MSPPRLLSLLQRSVPALLLGALVFPLPAGATAKLVDGIAAQVGTRIVLVSEVMRAVGPQEARMRKAGAPEQEIMKLRADALESLIEARLIEGVVAQYELYAKDEEVDQTIQAIAKENGLTLEQLYASVVFHGMTRDEYRDQIKHDLERRNVINAFVSNDVKVDDDAISALYQQRYGSMPATSEQVHVRQIVVSYGRGTTRTPDEACQLVAATRKRFEAGTSFEDLAKQVSEVAPSEGGDIGWLPTNQLADWMSQSLAGLQPGDVSDPILLPFGCSLLQLVERKQVERQTLEQARPALTQELWGKEMDKAYRKWMEGLREKTYIDRRGYFAEAAQFGEPTFPVAPPDEPPAP